MKITLPPALVDVDAIRSAVQQQAADAIAAVSTLAQDAEAKAAAGVQASDAAKSRADASMGVANAARSSSAAATDMATGASTKAEAASTAAAGASTKAEAADTRAAAAVESATAAAAKANDAAAKATAALTAANLAKAFVESLKIQTGTVVTAADGTVKWTYPVPYSVAPFVDPVPRQPSSTTAIRPVTVAIVEKTATYVVVRVIRPAAVKVSVLGANIDLFETLAAVTVDILAISPPVAAS